MRLNNLRIIFYTQSNYDKLSKKNKSLTFY